MGATTQSNLAVAQLHLRDRVQGGGARLGVEAMELYRHVNGREDLLEAIVDSLAVYPGEMATPPNVPDDVLVGW